MSFDRLWHVGTMNPADKGIRGPSFEGHGLSVSTKPEAWRRIARLGDAPVWELTRTDNVFLDRHGLEDEHWRHISDWAVANGYATRTQAFQACWPDGDYETGTIEPTFQEALDAMIGMGGYYPDIDPDSDDQDVPNDSVRWWGPSGKLVSWDVVARSITAIKRLVPTKALCDFFDWDYVAGNLNTPVDSWVAIWFAEQVLGLDGVWWQDVLDPHALSAPRGVIFPDRLGAWTVVPRPAAKLRPEVIELLPLLGLAPTP